MKNISLMLNAILIVAVGILYYLHFSSGRNGNNVQNPDALNNITDQETTFVDTVTISEDTIADPVITTVERQGRIAYINLEEFFEQYEFYKQGIKNIDRSIETKRKQLINKQKLLEDEFQKYQQTAPTLSDNYRKTKEQQLMEQEQELYKLRDQLQEEQQNEFDRFNANLLKKIDDYLKNLSKTENYNYVFTYSKGNPATIVFARDSLDITKQVLDGLNKEYRKK